VSGSSTQNTNSSQNQSGSSQTVAWAPLAGALTGACPVSVSTQHSRATRTSAAPALPRVWLSVGSRSKLLTSRVALRLQRVQPVRSQAA